MNRIMQELEPVHSVLRHLRPIMISLVALTLTAGIALAAKPSDAGAGHGPKAAEVTENVDTDTDQGTETDTDTETDPTTETPTGAATGAAKNCLTDPTTATPEALAALTHGAIVCWAAHQVTPDGYANHGAWVSEWARKNHGVDASAKGLAKAAEKAAKHAGGAAPATP
ncbi:MAG: hypothetical protein ABI573_12500 [Chloroflexota bacterium]